MMMIYDDDQNNDVRLDMDGKLRNDGDGSLIWTWRISFLGSFLQTLNDSLASNPSGAKLIVLFVEFVENKRVNGNRL